MSNVATGRVGPSSRGAFRSFQIEDYQGPAESDDELVEYGDLYLGTPERPSRWEIRFDAHSGKNPVVGEGRQYKMDAEPKGQRSCEVIITDLRDQFVCAFILPNRSAVTFFRAYDEWMAQVEGFTTATTSTGQKSWWHMSRRERLIAWPVCAAIGLVILYLSLAGGPSAKFKITWTVDAFTAQQAEVRTTFNNVGNKAGSPPGSCTISIIADGGQNTGLTEVNNPSTSIAPGQSETYYTLVTVTNNAAATANVGNTKVDC